MNKFQFQHETATRISALGITWTLNSSHLSASPLLAGRAYKAKAKTGFSSNSLLN